ncbi:MAG: transcription antitermination factor NusB [Candidatus Cloacimonadaceae bacterium]|nr:transcription antitermination factor NusB [Candidatus Cloacimonadota bacterium]MDX9950408.1 transcription antitermination factor NusB [Candidatus Syntrophosphaera sp.]NLN84907.1 transcription antitermination factor NusB [Candidatus Cloacimonadota bacterium]
MGLRRKARELAAKTLYALDFQEIDPQFREYQMLSCYPDLMAQVAELDKLENQARAVDFADDLVKNTVINLEQIQAEIEKHSENWSLEAISKMDLSILNIAVYELMFTGTPPPVVINEALEIAKKFCGEGSVAFLNGVLDSVNKEMRAREKINGLSG